MNADPCINEELLREGFVQQACREYISQANTELIYYYHTSLPRHMGA